MNTASTERTCRMRQGFDSGFRQHAAWLVFALAFLSTAHVWAQDGVQDGSMPGRGAFAGAHMVRGTVAAIAADGLTVKTEEGELFQVAVSANTRVMKDRQPVKLADIKVGDGIGAMGVLDAPAKTVHAMFVAVMGAEQVKKAREGLGKVYITGSVTAIDMDNGRITVKRPDGVSQVIQADEGTSFRRGGRRGQASANAASAADANASAESVTLADVKVGDMVMGRGAVKNDMFVPTELRVMDVAAGQGRRRGMRNGASAVSPNANAPESPR